MIEGTGCDRCGSPIPDDGVLAGRCPRCLLALGMESTTGLLDGDITLGSAVGTVIERPATAVGHYQLLRVIGEGGMGTVYEAQQEHPRRTVALKIMKAGIANPESLRRFEQEAEALGRLQHPGIAQIYEAGTADTGFGPQPYFAMELIRGCTPDEYVRERKLDVSQRLELVARIADAVHHAHQRGLIHRDLKPSNILVDDTGQPKVLDFGVTRVIDEGIQTSQRTSAGQLVGTLTFMSPEQVGGDPLEIDTRTDVYSLGVILYMLIAGRHPIESARRFHDVFRSIVEDDPVPLGSLDRRFKGDVETIAAKALEKDKVRRYGSAAELAADLRRVLKHEPIVARPLSTRYQLQKFARRHRAFVLAAAAVLVVLLIGVIGSASQAVRALRAERSAIAERDRARRAEEGARAERDRATAAETAATADRDRALDAEVEATRDRNRAVAAETQSRLQRDLAVAERNRADAEARVAREQALINVMRSLAHESVRHSVSRLDADRAALLARQAFLLSGETSDGPRYAIEDALQQAMRRDPWSHSLPMGAGTAAIAADGSLLVSGGRDTAVRVWDLRRPGANPRILRAHSTPVTLVAFAPDGSRFVSVSDPRDARTLAEETAATVLARAARNPEVRIWDSRRLDTPPVLLPMPPAPLTAIAFDPEGERLAAAGGSALWMWDLRQPGRPPTRLVEDTGVIATVAFAGAGTLVTDGFGVRLWDSRTGASLPRLATDPEATGVVAAVAVSPKGNWLAAGTIKGIIRVWRLNDPRAAPIVLNGHRSAILALALSPNDRWLASIAQVDGAIRVWDLERPDVEPLLLPGQPAMRSLAFSPDGVRLASAGLDSLWLWEVGSVVPRPMFDARSGESTAAMSPDGRWVVSLHNRSVHVRDLRSPHSAPVLLPDAMLGPFSALSRDGRWLASTAAANRIHVWDVKTPAAPSRVFEGHQGPVLSLALSDDGTRLATGSLDRTVRVWDVTAPDRAPVVIRLDGPQGIRALTFSADGTRLAFNSIDRVYIVDLTRSDAVAPLNRPGEGGFPNGVALSPDGSRLATADGVGQTVRLFDVRTPGAPPLVLTGAHDAVARSVAFSPDARHLASTGEDGTVRLWDLGRPEAPPLVLNLPDGPGKMVAFSPDSSRLYALGARTAYEWTLWSAAADYLCTRVWRNLTAAEWRLYVGDSVPYQRTCPGLPGDPAEQN